MPRHLIGLIVENNQVSVWQAEALMSIANSADFLVLNCVNGRGARRRPLKHAFYYTVNLISLRSKMTRIVPLPAGLKIRETMTFQPKPENNWQRLPDWLIDRINEAELDCIIKFGMGLLRVPERFHCPILSYHHGDPRRFRGRPAGFYELDSGEASVGQVVQLLSNRLDAGRIVAFAETRVYHHSYRQTMMEAFGRSPLLLREALRNCLSGQALPIDPNGRNYTLPSNAAVLRFLCRLGRRKLRRLGYGAFMEKRWQVALAPTNVDVPELAHKSPPKASWKTIPRPPNYRFIADPFPHPTSGILVEGLRRTDNCGEVVHIDGDRATVLCSGIGHFSYPATVCSGEDWFVVPEISEWASPAIYELTESISDPIAPLQIDGNPRLIDPTLYAYRDAVFLFANKLSEGMGVLRLWHADELLGRFREHPASPIRISPAGSRMAGAIVDRAQPFRLGQDCSRDYGNGIVFFAIERLTTSEYAEKEAGRLSFEGVKGPHTLNLAEGRVLFDFYDERINPLAGINRLRRLAFARF